MEIDYKMLLAYIGSFAGPRGNNPRLNLFQDGTGNIHDVYTGYVHVELVSISYRGLSSRVMEFSVQKLESEVAAKREELLILEKKLESLKGTQT